MSRVLMRRGRATYQFHADGTRAQCGRFKAANWNDAKHIVEKRLGYRRRLEWWSDGLRQVATHHGTRVVLRMLLPDGYGGWSEDGMPPADADER